MCGCIERFVGRFLELQFCPHLLTKPKTPHILNKYSLLLTEGVRNMPKFDGAGPMGMGPGTGRGFGPCFGWDPPTWPHQTGGWESYFRGPGPRGVPLPFREEVVLEPDELEALKLYEVDGLDQIGSAEKMKISQPTFARVIGSAHKKIAEAIVLGKAIKILQNPNV